MDLFDLLDREAERLVADFRDCLTLFEGSESHLARHAAAEAVLGRLATYTLVVEQVLQPALLALNFETLPAMSRTHERLRRVTAEALLAMRGPSKAVAKTLRATQQMLLRYRLRLRRDFYPDLYHLLSTSEALVLSDDMLQWVDRNCRQMPAEMPRPRSAMPRARVATPPPGARIPTLHHAVVRGAAGLGQRA